MVGPEAAIRYRASARVFADGVAQTWGSSQDAKTLYDGTNDEWTVQTKDSGGTQTDRVRVKANADITTVELFNDDAGATGIRTDVHHDSASPAGSDALYELRVYGDDDGGNKTQYGGFAVNLISPTNTSEGGAVVLKNMAAGTLTDVMEFRGKTAFIGDTANGGMTQGLTINQGASDDEILALKSSDVSHGSTGDVEADTYYAIKKASATEGGATMFMTAESTAAVVGTIKVQGGSATTTKTTSTAGLFDFLIATENNGNIGANGNVWSIRARVGGSWATRTLVDEDGDLYSVTAAQTFDDYDDFALLEAYDRARSGQLREAIQAEYGEWALIHEPELIKAGVLGARIRDGGLTNQTQLLRLVVGALRRAKHEIGSLKADNADMRRILEAA